MKRGASLFLVAMVLAGCGSRGDIESLRAENQQLKARIGELQRALDDERNGAARLLARARGEMDSGKLDAARATLVALQSRHPESREASEARALGLSIAASIERATKEQEQRKRVAAARMKTSFDEVRGITWYRDRETPVSGTFVEFYFGDFKTSGLGPLRFEAHFQGDDWLFVSKMTIKADEQVFPLDLGEWAHDNGSGVVWEWVDVKVEAQLLKVLNAMLDARKTIVRFNGATYYEDHVLTAGERSSMKAVMAAYVNLGGSLPQ